MPPQGRHFERVPGILKPTSLSRFMGTLLLASQEDPASMNILSEVMEIEGWGDDQEMPHGKVSRHGSGEAEVLLIEGLHIWADGIDLVHESVTGYEVDDVLVLSKHASASETPALTLHAIGVPGEIPHGNRARSGGITGKVVPPSTMFAHLFRTMSRIAIEDNLDQEYDITLETTHHGPLLDKPTLYLEIGSTLDRWEDKRAARVWSKTISQCLGLEGEDSLRWGGTGEVMLGLGGGHYAPRHKAVISETEVWVGHILANYALVFEEPDGGELPLGPWQHSVKVALDSTRKAFPGGDVFAHLDRKSFKGWQRQALSDLLSDLGVPILRGKQIQSP